MDESGHSDGQLVLAGDVIDDGLDATGRQRKKGESPWRGVARSLLRHRAFIVGGALLVLFILMAIFAPIVAPFDPVKTFVGPLLSPPSADHLMGTDDFGRDIFSRVVFASRSSLIVGVAAVAIAAIIGTTVGLLAGYNQRRLDSLLMRSVDVLLAFPGLMLALALAAMIGTGMKSVIIAVGIAGIPNFARVVRSSVMGVVEEEFVLAARSTGCSRSRIILSHVLPNVMSTVIVIGTLYLAFAVLGAASLSFLGVGILPPTPEWGAMTNAGRHVLVTAWWVSTFPGLAIVLFVVSVNVVGDALRDALDSTLRHT